MQDGADLVSDRDPAHVLAARTDATPEPETEREQQAGQHATVAPEHDAAAVSRHANPCVGRRCCRPFPLHANTGDEVVARRALLVERPVTAVAVVPDRRRRDEGRRRARQARERAREEAGALRARLEDQALARVGPPSVADAGAGEGDDAADADRKSTRLNSSHSQISYAVFCLKKKKELNYTSSLAPSSPASCENTSDTSNVYGHQGSS